MCRTMLENSKQKSQDIAEKSIESDWKVASLQKFAGKLLENNLKVVQFQKQKKKKKNLKLVKRNLQALQGVKVIGVIWKTQVWTEAVTGVAELGFGDRKLTKLDTAI